DEVEVMVLEIDEERRRISLGMKQCKTNPWDEFAATHNKGDKITGKIKSITDFGIFIGLDGGIDGLVHMSDISWTDDTEAAARDYKKGDDVETVILAVDAERERISLGIKQLEQDPFQNFLASNEKGSLVLGTIKEVDAKGAVIMLADNVEGYLRASEIQRDRVEDARTFLKEGEKIEAKFIGIDKKSKTISLSIKAKDQDEESEAIKDYTQQAAGTPTLGDIFKQMEK
ncbi:MAG: S1 RNA-binding domain-containing protein, partial [Methylicorpusculum sp.]|nr:S1 RNA-binding domain-containing protein [Methylicorpusculum sp.]